MQTIKVPAWVRREMDEYISGCGCGQLWDDATTEHGEMVTKPFEFKSNDAQWRIKGTATAKFEHCEDPGGCEWWKFEGARYYTIEEATYIDFYGIEYHAEL